MSETSTSEELQPVEFIPFNEFKNGLPFGRFRVIVNPKLSESYMKNRLNVVPVVLVLIVLGLAIAFYSSRWFGGAMVVIGVAINRLVKFQAAKMVLHLATKDQTIYRDLLDREIIEVRRA
jgi:predicted permease